MYRRPTVPPQPSRPMVQGRGGVYTYENLAPRHRPVATWALTALLVAAWLVQTPEIQARYSMLPAAIRMGEWWRIVTGSFLHGNLIHLAANAYFGWTIGARIERHIGPWRLLLITVVSMFGAGGAVAWLSSAPAVGFSGVLYGWLASWLAFHLTSRYPGLRLSGPQRSAYLQLLAANLLISLLPGISLLAHAGGFGAGFLVALLLGL